MSKSDDQQLNRRDVLRGGAILFGTAAVGFLPKIAQAQAVRTTKPVLASTAPARLMFWNGTRFIPATDLPSGDASLSTVDLKLRANTIDGSLKGLDVLLSASSKEPFMAWTAPTRGGTTTASFVAPVNTGQLNLVAIASSNSQIMEDGSPLDARLNIALNTGSGRGEKLMEGTYLLVSGSTSTTGAIYNPDNAGTPITTADGSPVRFQYLMLQIARTL